MSLAAPARTSTAAVPMPPAVRARILRDARMVVLPLFFPSAPFASMGLMAIVVGSWAPVAMLFGGAFLAIAVGHVTWRVRWWIQAVRDLREGVILRTTGPVLHTRGYGSERDDYNL
jgi:hypothetical protein